MVHPVADGHLRDALSLRDVWLSSMIQLPNVLAGIFELEVSFYTALHLLFESECDGNKKEGGGCLGGGGGDRELITRVVSRRVCSKFCHPTPHPTPPVQPLSKNARNGRDGGWPSKKCRGIRPAAGHQFVGGKKSVAYELCGDLIYFPVDCTYYKRI